MRRASTFLLLLAVLLILHDYGTAAPIQEVEGVILEVGEGYLIVRVDAQTEPRKFILRWRAKFVPPKLPLKGDRVEILYKDKDEGAVIYELNYLKPAPVSTSPGAAPDAPSSTPGSGDRR